MKRGYFWGAGIAGFIVLAAASATLIPHGKASTALAADAAPVASYVASSKSDVYHLPSCASAQRIKAENLVTYASKAEAEKDGKRACKICKP
jgi:hypothetical protein